jgi:hypothetical protein
MNRGPGLCHETEPRVTRPRHPQDRSPSAPHASAADPTLRPLSRSRRAAERAAVLRSFGCSRRPAPVLAPLASRKSGRYSRSRPWRAKGVRKKRPPARRRSSPHTRGASMPHRCAGSRAYRPVRSEARTRARIGRKSPVRQRRPHDSTRRSSRALRSAPAVLNPQYAAARAVVMYGGQRSHSLAMGDQPLRLQACAPPRGTRGACRGACAAAASPRAPRPHGELTEPYGLTHRFA